MLQISVHILSTAIMSYYYVAQGIMEDWQQGKYRISFEREKIRTMAGTYIVYLKLQMVINFTAFFCEYVCFISLKMYALSMHVAL